MIDVKDFIAVKGVKALGNKLSSLPVTEVVLEAPNVELEAAEASKVVEDVVVVEEPDTNEQPQASEPSNEVDPPVSEDGQASLF